MDDEPTVRMLNTDIFENVGNTVIAVGDRATARPVSRCCRSPATRRM